MSNEINPVNKSIEYLVDCGWTKAEAENLCAAIKSDKSGEHLWEIAPKWIEHCGEAKKYVESMLGLVAQGLINVTEGKDEDWMFSLNDKGLEAGKSLQEQSHE